MMKPESEVHDMFVMVEGVKTKRRVSHIDTTYRPVRAVPEVLADEELYWTLSGQAVIVKVPQ